MFKTINNVIRIRSNVESSNTSSCFIFDLQALPRNRIILNCAERYSEREIELKCKGVNVKLLRKVYLEKMRKDGFRTFQEQLSP